jgi:ribulose-5-phosphate 4-epimerase/fuculose-1-phosphate aldolase
MTALAKEQSAAAELIGLAQGLSSRGLLVAGLGAVACRLDDGRLLITPPDRPLRGVQTEQLRNVDPDQTGSPGQLFASLLERRGDARWIALTQPPAVMALSMAGVTVGRCLLASPPAELGDLTARPGSGDDQTALSVALVSALSGADEVVVDRFAVLSVAPDALTLEGRLERLEHAAALTVSARQLGGAAPVSEASLSAIGAALDGFGFRVGPDCARCNGCSLGRRHRGAPDAFGDRLDAAIGRQLAP